VDATDRQVWAGFLARRDDPRIYVEQAGMAGSAEGGR